MNDLDDIFDVCPVMFKRRKNEPDGRRIIIHAGLKRVKRHVPGAGEKYAFETYTRDRTVEIYVSPTGRSVRIVVDGQEVPKR